VFPDTALLQGTIRYFNEEVKEKVLGRIQEVCENVARAHGCSANVE